MWGSNAIGCSIVEYTTTCFSFLSLVGLFFSHLQAVLTCTWTFSCPSLGSCALEGLLLAPGVCPSHGVPSHHQTPQHCSPSIVISTSPTCKQVWIWERWIGISFRIFLIFILKTFLTFSDQKELVNTYISPHLDSAIDISLYLFYHIFGHVYTATHPFFNVFQRKV